MLFSYILGYSRKGNNQNRKQKSNADQLKLLNWPLSCCLSSSVQMIVTIGKSIISGWWFGWTSLKSSSISASSPTPAPSAWPRSTFLISFQKCVFRGFISSFCNRVSLYHIIVVYYRSGKPLFEISKAMQYYMRESTKIILSMSGCVPWKWKYFWQILALPFYCLKVLWLVEILVKNVKIFQDMKRFWECNSKTKSKFGGTLKVPPILRNCGPRHWHFYRF